jgi:hypothetical protein
MGVEMNLEFSLLHFYKYLTLFENLIRLVLIVIRIKKTNLTLAKARNYQ